MPDSLEDGTDDTKRENDIIHQLRHEAYAVRDCFTRHSFYAISATAPVLILVARFSVEYPYLGILSVLSAIPLFAVLSMGIHKYASSNRLLGYELHIQRMRHFNEKWRADMTSAGWEEIMRAWRIVYPTLEAQIYEPSQAGLWRVFPTAFRLKLCPIHPSKTTLAQTNINGEKNDDVFWFDQHLALKNLDHVRYESGGYLQTHKYIFSIMIHSCFLIGIISLYRTINDNLTNIETALCVIFLLVAIVISYARWRNMWSRIDILENGMGSIHACAIIWEATTLAHLRSLKKLGFYGPQRDKIDTMHGYTAKLAEISVEIAQNSRNIHRWIGGSRTTYYENHPC